MRRILLLALMLGACAPAHPEVTIVTQDTIAFHSASGGAALQETEQMASDHCHRQGARAVMTGSAVSPVDAYRRYECVGQVR